ncbi:MAG: hypothetical protein M1820_006314 [Bogoriella megaspora]|nr:MAG: hypothetical protein M1820_006314 [Bogoriella megaspora]
MAPTNVHAHEHWTFVSRAARVAEFSAKTRAAHDESCPKCQGTCAPERCSGVAASIAAFRRGVYGGHKLFLRRDRGVEAAAAAAQRRRQSGWGVVIKGEEMWVKGRKRRSERIRERREGNRG